MDRPVRIYLVRHGESEANVAHRFANGVEGYPLTERGRGQAEVLAERLMAELDARPTDSLHTSPVRRALETAEVLADRLQTPLSSPDAALAEFDVGDFEGTDDPEHWQAYESVMSGWLLDGEMDRRLPGGESYRDIEERFMPFLRGLIDDSTPGDTHVLVSHGGLIRTMVPLIAENVDGRFAHANGIDNVDWVLLSHTREALRCLRWGDHVFGGVRPRPPSSDRWT